MKIVTVSMESGEVAAIRLENRLVSLSTMNQLLHTQFGETIQELLERGELSEVKKTVHKNYDFLLENSVPMEDVRFGPLYRFPRKIWGIGLNYREHAGDLNAVLPTEEPASFMKADTTIIGTGDKIVLPRQSTRVTAEAELALVIGKNCKNVSVEEAQNYVAGFTSVIDMTAEDILQKNPRYLTRAKNFDTFFSFGPELLTCDEVTNLENLKVGTYRNEKLNRENMVSNMTFHPWYLVSFHSQVMTLLPGDIISTGTPGAVVIRDGDTTECRIDGFLPLINPVVQG